jgi:anti-sigma regulatory factor (Ser/Thr protein kinase)
MRVGLPNRAYLADLERFTHEWTSANPEEFVLDLSRGAFSLHPMVLCMLASMATSARDAGHVVRIENEQNTAPIRYLERMKLFEAMGVATGISVAEHEPAGRFIPVTAVTNSAKLGEFLTDFVPLLHADPEEAVTVRYVLSELVRNTLEHSGPPHIAYVAAQVTKSGRLLLGVSDCGVGIWKTITRYHTASDDRAAIVKAFEPGISGATPRFGGNENNGGAGLFFMKAMAVVARTHMVAVSGRSMMKLRFQPPDRPLNASLESDRVYWRDLDTPFDGTAVGIDIQINESIKFKDLLSEIRSVYNLRVKTESQRKRKARFA